MPKYYDFKIGRVFQMGEVQFMGNKLQENGMADNQGCKAQEDQVIP